MSRWRKQKDKEEEEERTRYPSLAVYICQSYFVCLFVSFRQDGHKACMSRHHLRLVFMALMHLKIASKDSARFFFLVIIFAFVIIIIINYLILSRYEEDNLLRLPAKRKKKVCCSN